MRIVLIVFLILSSLQVAAQSDAPDSSAIDGSSGFQREHGFFYKPRFMIGLSGYNSLVDGRKVRVGGLRLGLEYRKRWRFGFSIQQLNPPIFRTGGTDTNPVFYKVEFGYVGLFSEYVYLTNRWSEGSIGVLVGAGDTKVGQRFNENDDFVPTRAVSMTLIQGYTVVYFKPWKWIGIGPSIGYRNVSSKSEDDPELAELVRIAFDGPIWAVKTKIYLGELWRALFKKKDKKKKKKKGKTIDRGELENF